jgi:hypothetical protein
MHLDLVRGRRVNARREIAAKNERHRCCAALLKVIALNPYPCYIIYANVSGLAELGIRTIGILLCCATVGYELSKQRTAV